MLGREACSYGGVMDAPTPLPAPRSSFHPDVLSGLSIALWYALPDYSRSRRTRTLAKTGIVAASAVYAHRIVARERSADGRDGGTAPVPIRTGPGSPRGAVVAGLTALALLGSTAAVMVGMERLVYRLGENLSRDGVRFAHTRIGGVVGAVSFGSTMAISAVHARRSPVAPTERAIAES